MRRKDREMTDRSEMEGILLKEETGYLATCGEDGQPMATPVNYIYKGGRIIMHCALAGRKLDNIAKNPKVGFTVVTDVSIDRVNMTTYYRSVMLEGTARLLEEGNEKAKAIKDLTERLAAPGEVCSDAEGRRTAMLVIDIASMCGKKNIGKI
ncbi:MAG TPA: pyridoxamine 5'-phosphate oxidase family protein [Bacillota bacterium]|nr:pyridoxamine 5'-phosphate oxidase family protein [Bacillota bacterium]HOA14901.1 pyridoxamine 5'-phosphate oxidase family protein [Bacillota bacterium]HOG53456.1 pyridoxamine 5'-phosphate oxidase family protein [Bacillota bacterium]